MKGKIKSLSFNVDNTHEVRIKNEVSGEKFDYTSADVIEIKLAHPTFRVIKSIEK